MGGCGRRCGASRRGFAVRSMRRAPQSTSLRSRATPQTCSWAALCAAVRCVLTCLCAASCAPRADELQFRAVWRANFSLVTAAPARLRLLHLSLFTFLTPGGADRDAAGAGARHLLRARGGGAAAHRPALRGVRCSAASPPRRRAGVPARRASSPTRRWRARSTARCSSSCSTLAVARRRRRRRRRRAGPSSAAASAAVFGGGALLALVFPPAAPVIDDSDDEAAPPPARIGAGPGSRVATTLSSRKKSR